MNAEAVVQLAQELGVALSLAGDRIRYAPKSATPPDLVEALRQHKAEVMALLQDQAPALPKRYRLKYPDALATKQELREIVDRVYDEGYVLLWSTVLKDLMAFYRDEESRGKIPPGFVPYSVAEVEELHGDGKPPLSKSALKLIHEAKKRGARVIGAQPEQGRKGA